jgi:hypothetical protein
MDCAGHFVPTSFVCFPSVGASKLTPVSPLFLSGVQFSLLVLSQMLLSQQQSTSFFVCTKTVVEVSVM